ncbi:polyadenylate-binding protein 1-like [Homarus americanus]|uniref:polyadenylate-binding protein 1-like n=1 Tax=Homarus americanus TaxID=6706 RepID=UPI001C483BD7|nr:polyadenylate-binding protein 1-like [Homarus americanus]
MSKVTKPPTVTVVVRNLPVSTTEAQLRSLCENFGGIVEVEIPRRTEVFVKFIFGFVRFVSLDAALNAVMKLNGLVVQQRRINAEVARSHWRNTNKQTVMHEGFDGDDSKDEETNSSLSMDDINTTIIQICHRQWQQHRRRHRDTDLPSFGRIMGMLAKLPTSEDEESETEVES